MTDQYSVVKCTKEVNKRPLYDPGLTYSFRKTTGDKEVKYWVGIPGQAGHDFSEEQFNLHFEIVQ